MREPTVSPRRLPSLRYTIRTARTPACSIRSPGSELRRSSGRRDPCRASQPARGGRCLAHRGRRPRTRCPSSPCGTLSTSAGSEVIAHRRLGAVTKAGMSARGSSRSAKPEPRALTGRGHPPHPPCRLRRGGQSRPAASGLRARATLRSRPIFTRQGGRADIVAACRSCAHSATRALSPRASLPMRNGHLPRPRAQGPPDPRRSSKIGDRSYIF
jgi:hypothetical protein